MTDGAGGAGWRCKLCGRLEGEVAFESSEVPKGSGNFVKRRVCKPCRRPQQRGKMRAAADAVALRPVLFVPDCHHPFVDVGAWSLMLRAAAVLKPHTIAVLGDFADFYAVSFHDKDPKRVQNLRWEVEQVNAALDQLDALGAERKVYVEGNHEWRLDRFLAQSAPALADWPGLSVPEAFRLKERGWEFAPYRTSTKVGRLHITHDTGQAGQNAHRQAGAKFRGSSLIGHTHRFEVSVLGAIDGDPSIHAMFGWLGSFDDVDYMHQANARASWAHGFGVGYEEVDTGIVHIQPVPIVAGRCVVGGQLIT